MGALTLKNFPFELRGWDLEKFNFVDPTDGFGTDTKIFICKSKIINVEPAHNNNAANKWLTDKGRQFFDGFILNQKTQLKKQSWAKILSKILNTLYIFEHCKNKNNKNHFFTFIFDHLSVEILSVLIFLSQNYSIITLRKTEKSILNTDLESNFQLNNLSEKLQLNFSTFCVCISTNPRYEGSYLNLNLRQRLLKGNFKCLIFGSLINLTFPLLFLGSNFNIIKNLSEGNNLICQDLKFSTNPILIYNQEFFKQNNSKNTSEILKRICFSNIFDKTWNGLGVLSSKLSDTGSLNLNSVPKLMLKDLKNCSSLFFLNVTNIAASDLQKIAELKLLRKLPKSNDKIIFDQNKKNYTNLKFSNQIFDNYLHIPSSTIFENEETFISTNGFIKRTTKIVPTLEHKNGWQILRKLLKHLKKTLISASKKNNQILFFNSNKIHYFKNFIGFQFCSTQILTHLNFYLSVKNKIVVLNQKKINFKPNVWKFTNIKSKYWLDDFFSSNKDEYSRNSLTLIKCSRNLRAETTNFF